MRYLCRHVLLTRCDTGTAGGTHSRAAAGCPHLEALRPAPCRQEWGRAEPEAAAGTVCSGRGKFQPGGAALPPRALTAAAGSARPAPGGRRAGAGGWRRTAEGGAGPGTGSLCVCASEGAAFQVSRRQVSFFVVVFFFPFSFPPSPPEVWFGERPTRHRQPDGRALSGGKCPRSGARRSGAAFRSPPRAGEAGPRRRHGRPRSAGDRPAALRVSAAHRAERGGGGRGAGPSGASSLHALGRRRPVEPADGAATVKRLPAGREGGHGARCSVPRRHSSAV